MKYALKIAAVYQIIVWSIAVYQYVIYFSGDILPMSNLEVSLAHLEIIILLSLLVIWSNLNLLFNNKNEKSILRHSVFNCCLNTAQVFNYTIFGCGYHVLLGIHAIAYYITDGNPNYYYDLGYQSLMEVERFPGSKMVFLTVNLVPIVLSVIFFKNAIKLDDEIYGMESHSYADELIAKIRSK